MIYIAWTTILAGIIFCRKSMGGLAATAVLASTILMVAGLSWLDPEITPLVPVLRSYWLTIHVSLEAGSYGFLALGAIIGVLNLISMIFINENNKARVSRTIKEMNIVSEMTLIGGLVTCFAGNARRRPGPAHAAFARFDTVAVFTVITGDAVITALNGREADHHWGGGCASSCGS